MKRKALIIAVAIVGLLVAGVLGAEAYLKNYVRKTIESALSDTGATVDIGRIAISLPRRQVALHRVKIVAQNDDPAQRGGDIVSLDVALESLTARGIRFKKVGGLPAVGADRLILASPRGTLVTKETTGVDTLPASGNFLETISGKLSSLDIGRVAVTGAALEYVKWLSDSENTRLSLGEAELSVRDVTLEAPPRDIRLRVDSVVYGFGAGSKVLRADSVRLDGDAGTLALGGFALVPQFSKHEFARRSETHEDWTAITLGTISCSGVDFERLISEKMLSIDSVSLASADIASYKNKKVYQQPRTKRMLYQSIQRLPLPVDIKALSFENLDVTYDELAANGSSPGVVTLSGGSGKAVNVTNIAEGHDRFITIDLSTVLFASGRLNVRFRFPVSAADNHWEVTGRLGATDMKAFNRAIEPLMNARITSGRIKSIDFAITGTLARSHTDMTMAYNDLQVEFLDKHDRKRGFLTFLVDDVLIRSDNPGRDGRGKLRDSKGEYERDPERSMWNYLWHSLFSAILKTVV